MAKEIEQCESVCEGMRCEQDKKHHRKNGKYLKHSSGGCSWTDAGAERIKREQETTFQELYES